MPVQYEAGLSVTVAQGDRTSETAYRYNTDAMADSHREIYIFIGFKAVLYIPVDVFRKSQSDLAKFY